MKTSLLLLVTLLASCTCQEASDPPVPAAAPLPQHADIIVLVTVDTLRSDFVSFGGYAQPTTPYVDALTEKGTWFSHAFSPSSWTAPSMASLFTGVYPTTHGVQTGGKDLETGEVVVPILSEPLETLAESLQAAGYRTIGTPSNRLLAKDRGFAQGFDTYPDKAPFIEANKVNAIVRRQLKAAYGDTWKTSWKNDKVFLWIHYYDPHLPWPPHPKLAPKFAPDFNGSLDTFPIDQNAKQLAKRFPDPDAEDVRRFRAMYAQDVRYFDEQFKILSTELGLDDPNVALFITSDHGEEIFEHGDLSHGNTLFDDVVRVPMMIRWPAHLPARGQSKALVNLLDVHATVLDVAGIAAPEGTQGHSLLPLLKEGTDGPSEVLLFEVDPPLDPTRPNQIGITDGRWKLVQTRIPENPVGLYDLNTPLGERTDVAADHPEIVERLQQQMTQGFDTLPVAESKPTADADAALIEELRAMGYVQ
jgi:arylsulfatase A-like enzyme